MSDTLGSRVFSRLRQEFSLLAEGRHKTNLAHRVTERQQSDKPCCGNSSKKT